MCDYMTDITYVALTFSEKVRSGIQGTELHEQIE